MTDRKQLMAGFLDHHGWGAAICEPLADDASFRRYERLTLGAKRAVIMDAPPEFEDIHPFVAVAIHLQNQGLAAPTIYACDMVNGFLLLEDMGDDLFARVMAEDPTQEESLYQLAIDGLVHLHQATLPTDMSRYDMDVLLRELGLFVDWYLPAVCGKPLSDRDRAEFLALWQDILPPVAGELTVLTLRDYHAENLMVRSGQAGLARLGLLDFQDAVIGHPAYDLVSLLQDARRDVSEVLEQDMRDNYIRQSGTEAASFIRDYALLGAQRNAKIIGIFTRLYLRDGKGAYLDKIEKVWALLERDLEHPALATVKTWMDAHIAREIRARPFVPKFFMPRSAMILAAGLGNRMRPLSDNCPKPLITVAGKELLSYSLDGLCAAGVRDVVINIHYLADQMEDFIRHYYDHRLTLIPSDERAQLMDSGGGVKKALPSLDAESFLVLNSDMIWQDGARPMLHRMQAFWQDADMDILMLLVPRDGAFGFDGVGDYHRDDAGRLTARGKDSAADYIYGGIIIMKAACFDGVTETAFSLRQQFNRAEAEGRLFGVIHDGEWYHVGTPDARDKLEDKFITCHGG
ncbi:MAG: phosphotransferase [Emcibacter sp.]|nr:phosphotransferase [Emcibacter sp.]